MSEPLLNIMVGEGALALIGPGGPLVIDRKQLANLTEFLVALQDICEPESDNEENDLEDSFALSWYANGPKGPGCDIADAGGPSWIERINQTRRPYGSSDPSTIGAHEDAEDEDSDTGDDEGEPDFAKPPRGHGPGCMISDSDYGGEEAGEPEWA